MVQLPADIESVFQGGESVAPEREETDRRARLSVLPDPTPGLDALFGADPHPILGKRSNRLPGLSRNFEVGNAVRQVPRIIPWTEALATTFVTIESEARDRALATAELMLVAEWILTSAHEILVQQGNASALERPTTATNPTIRLTYGDTGAIFVRTSTEFEVVSLVRIRTEIEPEDGPDSQDPGKFCRIHIKPPQKEHVRFRFSRLRWYVAKSRHQRRENDQGADDGAPSQNGGVGYECHGDPVDPAQLIVNFIHAMVPV